jgi:hypothetical protein
MVSSLFSMEICSFGAQIGNSRFGICTGVRNGAAVLNGIYFRVPAYM